MVETFGSEDPVYGSSAGSPVTDRREMPMSAFDNIKDQASKAASENPDKVEQFSDQGIEKAGDAVDQKTGGKFSDKVDQAQQAGDQRVGDNSQ